MSLLALRKARASRQVGEQVGEEVRRASLGTATGGPTRCGATRRTGGVNACPGYRRQTEQCPSRGRRRRTARVRALILIPTITRTETKETNWGGAIRSARAATGEVLQPLTEYADRLRLLSSLSRCTT